MNIQEFVGKLIEKSTIVLLILGVAVTLVAAADGIQWGSERYLPVGDPLWRVVLAVVGIGLIACGVFLIFKEKGETGEKVEARAEAYGVEIKSPVDHQSFTGAFWVEGTYKSLPDNLRLGLFELSDSYYWPKNAIQVDKLRKTWRVSNQIWIGVNRGQKADILVAVMGKGGQAMYDYFRDSVRPTIKDIRTRFNDQTLRMPGIRELTPDTVECHRITVVKR